MKLTLFGSTPTFFATSMGKRWSGPPGDEPPPMVTFEGSAFQAVTKSCMVSNGESAGTKTAPGSSINFAMAVASEALMFDPLV